MQLHGCWQKAWYSWSEINYPISHGMDSSMNFMLSLIPLTPKSQGSEMEWPKGILCMHWVWVREMDPENRKSWYSITQENQVELCPRCSRYVYCMGREANWPSTLEGDSLCCLRPVWMRAHVAFCDMSNKVLCASLLSLISSTTICKIIAVWLVGMWQWSILNSFRIFHASLD